MWSRTSAGACNCTSKSVPQKVQLFEESCPLSLQPLSQSVYLPELENNNRQFVKTMTLVHPIISAPVRLTSPSPHEVVWLDPAEGTAAPGPAPTHDWYGPVPALTRHWSASVSHFLPW